MVIIIIINYRDSQNYLWETLDRTIIINYVESLRYHTRCAPHGPKFRYIHILTCTCPRNRYPMGHVYSLEFSGYLKETQKPSIPEIRVTFVFLPGQPSQHMRPTCSMSLWRHLQVRKTVWCERDFSKKRYYAKHKSQMAGAETYTCIFKLRHRLIINSKFNSLIEV